MREGALWQVSWSEIEQWYVILTGEQWAKLVSDGTLDPISVVVHLESCPTRECVLAAIEQWKQTGVVSVREGPVQSDSSVIAAFGIDEALRQRPGLWRRPQARDHHNVDQIYTPMERCSANRSLLEMT